MYVLGITGTARKLEGLSFVFVWSGWVPVAIWLMSHKLLCELFRRSDWQEAVVDFFL